MLLTVVALASLVSLVVYRKIVSSLHDSLFSSIGALETVHASENFHSALHNLLTISSRPYEGLGKIDTAEYALARQEAVESYQRLTGSIGRNLDPDQHVSMDSDPNFAEDTRQLFDSFLKEIDAALGAPDDLASTHLKKARVAFDELFEKHLNVLHSRHEVRLEALKSNAHGLAKRADLFFYIQIAILLASAIVAILFSDRVLLKGFRAVEHGALTDGLTGLKNRRYLEGPAMVDVSTMIRSGLAFSVVIADVDHFKLFNDRNGHQAGDAALKEVAFQFQSGVRKTDMVIRYGGEEFLAILPGADKTSAMSTAHKIQAQLEKKEIFLPSGTVGTLTASFGVASYPEEGIEEYPLLLKKADERLYEAKLSGRNKVVG
jgi:diguanylate cyclase (GGDEF)-like protein